VVRAEKLSWRQLGRPSPGFMTVCEERTWAREAEEFPLLEAVARELPVKTQQAGKGLAGSVGISGGAVSACSSESCV
jgi:hypothetical protein